MVNLPKLQAGRDSNEEKDKKQVIFRNSYRNAASKKEDSFRINHIVRGARENYEAVSTPVIPARSNSNFNRAQLTPLKNDAIQRPKFQASYEDRNRRNERLDPISFGDSQKRL